MAKLAAQTTATSHQAVGVGGGGSEEEMTSVNHIIIRG